MKYETSTDLSVASIKVHMHSSWLKALCITHLCAFWIWSSFYRFQVSLRLTLPTFPRPAWTLSTPALQWQSGQPYLVLPASLIHNIITFTWPCHASYRRRMSPTQGQLGNGPHPNFRTGRNHLSFSICMVQSLWRCKEKREEENDFLPLLLWFVCNFLKGYLVMPEEFMKPKLKFDTKMYPCNEEYAIPWSIKQQTL